jgi:hypothetical protein
VFVRYFLFSTADFSRFSLQICNTFATICA